MSERTGFGDLLSRGAELAREDARRIVEELLARGDVSREEAEQIERGVLEAMERGRRFVETRFLEPLQSAAGSVVRGFTAGAASPGSDDTRRILARLEAIDARLARLERRVQAGDREGD